MFTFPNNPNNTQIVLLQRSHLATGVTDNTQIKILFASIEVDKIKLQVLSVEPCRAMINELPSSFLLVSFANFRLEKFKDTKEYVKKVMMNGIKVVFEGDDKQSANNDHSSNKNRINNNSKGKQKGENVEENIFNFFGHSNSQLKSKTCLFFKGNITHIEEKIKKFGNFDEISNVPKKAKRLGLVFSSCKPIMDVPSKLF